MVRAKLLGAMQKDGQKMETGRRDAMQSVGAFIHHCAILSLHTRFSHFLFFTFIANIVGSITKAKTLCPLKHRLS
jgi:hypothetical protein